MSLLNNFVEVNHDIPQESIKSFLPKYTYIPFKQGDSSDYRVSVTAGMTVEEGQSIASNADIFSVKGADIHASLPGTVEDIVQCTLPNGHLGMAAKIKTEGKFTYLGHSGLNIDWNLLDKNQILETFKIKGVVNSFESKVVSLYTEISENTLEKNRFLVVRMFDEDPGLITDQFVAKKYTSSVIEGSRIIAKAYDAVGIIFILPKKGYFEIETQSLSDCTYCVVPVDNTRYPCGTRVSIIKHVKKLSRNPDYAAFSSLNHKCLFVDSVTAYSAYESVVKGIPVVERFVNVNGNCLNSVGIFKVRIGASIRDLVEQCGGFKIHPSKIVINGIVKGNAVSSMDIPVTKDVKSVSFLKKTDLCYQKSTSCIRCGKCRSECPENLVPDLYYKYIFENYHLSKDIIATAQLCSQCYVCNCVCPSRLPLSQTVSILGKKNG